jgi:hypothetical protein
MPLAVSSLPRDLIDLCMLHWVWYANLFCRADRPSWMPEPSPPTSPVKGVEAEVVLPPTIIESPVRATVHAPTPVALSSSSGGGAGGSFGESETVGRSNEF